MWNKVLQIVLFAGLLIGAGSCIDRGADYDECVNIEEARCQLRDVCGDDFDPDFDWEHCVDYAGENCRVRGIEGEFAKNDIEDCMSAILDVACADLDPAVDETEELAACAFIEGDEEDEE